MAVMIADLGVKVPRAQRAAMLPRAQPRIRRAQHQLGAATTLRIGNHLAVHLARPGKQLHARIGLVHGHGVVQAPSRAERHVARAVGIHDKHVRAAHVVADAQANPLVGRLGADLDVDAAGARGGSGFGHAPLEAYLARDGAVGCGCGVGRAGTFSIVQSVQVHLTSGREKKPVEGLRSAASPATRAVPLMM